MIVYTNLCPSPLETSGLEKRIRQRIPSLVEYFHDLNDLGGRLRTRIYDIDIIVIHVCRTSPIAELLEYQQDLKELDIVLVLNDSIENEQLTRLLRLFPRYMAFDPDDNTILNLLENRIAQHDSGANKTVAGRR